MRLIITLVILMCAFRSFAFVAPSNRQEQIALVLADDQGQALSSPVKSFYLKVQSEFLDRKKTPLISRAEMLRLLPSLRFAGTSIPLVSKLALHKVLEPAKSRRDKKNQIQFIAPLQKALDTLAIKGAVVVDCSLVNENQVQSCALHYYDRSQAKIYASTSKSFLVPIDDPGIWASPLVANLEEGLKRKNDENKQAEIDALLAETEQHRANPMSFALALGAASESLTSGKLGTQNHLVLNATAFIVSEQAGWGLQYGQGKSGDAHLSAENSNLLFMLNSFVKAMDRARWQMNFGIGIAKRALIFRDVESKIISQSAVLRAEPGFAWAFTSHLALGVDFHYAHYFGGTDENIGAFDGKIPGSLSRNSTGFGVGLRWDF